MAIGRISGSVLKSNLTRNGTDLAFETNLLYLDVTNNRIGIGTSEPSQTLHVSGTTLTTDLTVSGDATVQGSVLADRIQSTGSNADITLDAQGTGSVNINSPLVINGSISTSDSTTVMFDSPVSVQGGQVATLANTTANQVVTTNSTNTALVDSGMIYNSTSQSLGIGVASASDIDARLHIVGTGTANDREVLFKVNNSNDHDRIEFIDEADTGNLPSALRNRNATRGIGLIAESGPVTLYSGGSAASDAGLIVNTNGSVDIPGELQVDRIISTGSNANIKLDPQGTGVVDVSSTRITNVTDPSADQDAATKAYVDSQLASADTLQEVTDNGATTTNETTFSGGIITNKIKTSDSSSLYINSPLRVDGLGDQNEIVVVGANGLLTSSALLTIDTNNERIGIGTTSPARTFHLVGESQFEASMRIDQYHNSNDGPDILLQKARGNVASPAASQSGDELGKINAYGHDGTAFRISAQFRSVDNGSQGGDWQFYTGESGNSSVQRLVIDHDGTVIVRKDLDVEGTLKADRIQSTGSNEDIVLDPQGTGTVNVNSTKITNVTDPTSAQDAATKAYVDAQVTASDLDFTADDSTTNSIDLDSEVMQFSGGTGITTSAINNTVTTSIDSTVATLTGTQTLENKTLRAPTFESGSNSPEFLEQRFVNATQQNFVQLYTGGNNGTYFTQGEYQKIATITPSGNAQNYTFIIRMTATSASNYQIVTFSGALRSNTLPDLSFTTNYYEEHNGTRFIEPKLWTKETTTAGFILAFEYIHNDNLYGGVNVEATIIPRSDDQRDNVSFNTTQDSEITSIDTGFTENDPTLIYANVSGTLEFGTQFRIEGSTADGNELTITATDPTADRTATFPDATGNVVLDSATQTLTNKTLTTPTISGKMTVDEIKTSDSSSLYINSPLRIDGLGEQNEIIIVGANGLLTSTSTLTIDDGNNYIGINQTSPAVTLHMTGEGAQSAQIRMEQHNDSGDAPDIRTRKSRGTAAAPTINSAGDFIFRGNFERYDGSAYDTVGQLAVDTNSGDQNRFQLTLTVSEDGNSIDAADAQFKIDGNDSGAITFNNAYKFPTADGSNGQALITDGSGTLSFGSVTSSDTLSDVTGRGASTSDQVTLSGGLVIGGNVETADSSNINFADAITANTGTSQFYNLQINNEISLGGTGAQYLAFNEDSVKVKFANWYSSNDRQYGQGQLWYEMFFAAVDNTDTQDRRRIGFYLEKPNKGASNAEEGSGAHPNNHRAFVDVDSFTLSNKNPLRFEEAIDDSSNIFYTQLQGQSALSANRTITLPDATGTVALTSDITLSTLSVTATATELNHLDGITGITLGDANETLIVDTDGNSITTTDLLAFDTGNNRVGIGTTSPATKFHIAGEGSANEGQIRLQQAYDGSDGPDFAFYASRGTIASPTSTANNDTQGRINAYVHNGTSFVQSGSFGWSSDGTDGDNTFDIRSRVSGTIAKRIEITATGVVQVPGDLEVQGTLNADRIQSSGSNADIVLDPQGTGVIDASTSKITNVTDPTADQDAATKAYVDSQLASADTLQEITDNGATTTTETTFSGGIVTSDIRTSDSTALYINSPLRVDGLGSENEIMVVGANGLLTSENLISIDSGNNRVGVNTSSPRALLDISSSTSGETRLFFTQADNSTDAPNMRIEKARGSVGSEAAVADNDGLYRQNVFAHDGSNYIQVGNLEFEVDGTVGTNNVPTKFTIGTGNNGVTERFRIEAAGDITFNNAYTFPTADGSANQVLQTDGSGNLDFVDMTTTGDITFNGSTIQSPSNADITLDPGGTGVVRITSNILPDTTTTYDIGSDSLRFNDIYLAGTTVDIGGTKLQRTSSGDVEIKEGSNRKRLLVDEVHIGQGNNLVKLKRGDNGRLKQLDNSDNDLPILTVVGDDSSGTDFNAGEDIKIAGGTNITTAMSGDTLTVTGATDIVANNITSNDSSAIRINDGLSMAGHIIPAGDSYDLGSSSSPWRDVYVSAGSLYVNNKQVLLDDSGTITVQTDADENLVIKTSGTGQTTVQSAAGVNITASSSADITLTTSTGNIELKGTVEVLTGKQITDSAGTNVQFGDSIHMNNNKITNVSDPTADQDVATKAYVDNNSASLTDILTVAGDDSTGTSFNSGETLKIAGATGITTAMSGDTLTITGPDLTSYIQNTDTALTLVGDDSTGTSITLSEIFKIAGATNITTAVSGDTLTITGPDLSSYITASSTDTLTNKTFDVEGTGNSISNIDVADFKAAAIVTESEGIGSNDNDTTLPTSAAVKDYVDSASANTGDITFTGSTIQSPSNADITMDPGGTGTVTSESDIVIKSRNDIVLNDSDNSAHISLRAPNAVTTSTTLTLPDGAGTSGQVLSTDGAGVLSWADSGGGGGSGASYPNSTVSTMPGSDGDYDLAKNAAQSVSETPFEVGGTDAFGVNLGTVFDMMDPIGTTETTDLGDGEAYVGA